MSDDLVTIARAIPPRLETHYEGCEAYHRDCLIRLMADEIERLRIEHDELSRDFDRRIEEIADLRERHGRALMEQDALRALLSDIRAEGRITGDIAVRLIVALWDKHE
jgi:hypothetical protein